MERSVVRMNKEFTYDLSMLDMREIYSQVIASKLEFPEFIVVEEVETGADIIRCRIDYDETYPEDVIYIKNGDNIFGRLAEEILQREAEVIEAPYFLEHCLDSEQMKIWYEVVLIMSDILNIRCPQVSFHSDLNGDGEIFDDNSLVMLPDLLACSFISMVTLIAHELRHAWQHINKPEWNKNYLSGDENNTESYLLQPAEIDAEAFARKLMEVVWGIDLFRHPKEEVTKALIKRKNEIDIVINKKKVKRLREIFADYEHPEDYRKNL